MCPPLTPDERPAVCLRKTDALRDHFPLWGPPWIERTSGSLAELPHDAAIVTPQKNFALWGVAEVDAFLSPSAGQGLRGLFHGQSTDGHGLTHCRHFGLG